MKHLIIVLAIAFACAFVQADFDAAEGYLKPNSFEFHLLQDEGPIIDSGGIADSGAAGDMKKDEMIEVISLQRIAAGISMPTSIKFAQPPGANHSMLYVATQTGQIWEFDIWAEMRPLAELLANRTANDSNLVYSGVDQMVDDDAVVPPPVLNNTGNATMPPAPVAEPDDFDRLDEFDVINFPDMNITRKLLVDLSSRILFLNAGYDERGLLGLAFHPDFSSNGRFFVQYSSRTPELYGTTSPDQRYFCDACQPEVFDHVEIFAEYLYGSAPPVAPTPPPVSGNDTNGTVAPTPTPVPGNDTVLPTLPPVNGSNNTVMQVDDGIGLDNVTNSSVVTIGATWVRDILAVQKHSFNHNGINTLTFNPWAAPEDAPWLYFGIGDGGCSYDPYENAQRPNAIVGKLHRLNVDAIAQQNLSCSTPALTVDQLLAACPAYASVVETVAIGVRNPASIVFDQVENVDTGNLTTNATARNFAMIVTDVGESAFEEINYVTYQGANLGWDRMEGFMCVDPRLDKCGNYTGDGPINVVGNDTVNGTAAPIPQDWSFGHVAPLTAADSLLQPIAVISHKDPAMYNPAAIVGGSVYYGPIEALQGAYIFPTLGSDTPAGIMGNSELFFIKLDNMFGDNATEAQWFNKTVAGDYCATASADVLPESQYSVDKLGRPNTLRSQRGAKIHHLFLEYIFYPSQNRFSGAMGANEDNTELFWGLKESISPVAIDGSIYRIVPRKQSLLGLALQDAPNNSTAPVQ